MRQYGHTVIPDYIWLYASDLVRFQNAEASHCPRILIKLNMSPGIQSFSKIFSKQLRVRVTSMSSSAPPLAFKRFLHWFSKSYDFENQSKNLLNAKGGADDDIEVTRTLNCFENILENDWIPGDIFNLIRMRGQCEASAFWKRTRSDAYSNM